MDFKIKYGNKKIIILIILTIILGVGVSLAATYFAYSYQDSRENKLVTDILTIDFQDGVNNINLSNASPVVDDVGLASTPYEFMVTNTSKVPINAIIKLDLQSVTNQINLGAIRYALYIDDQLVIKNYLNENLVLYTYENLIVNQTLNCRLYMWIDYYYDKPNTNFNAKVKVEGSTFDNIASKPITVTFNANGGNLNNASKNIYYHGYYGNLPEPTREGYTFMGWNGKNMLEDEKIRNYSNWKDNLVTDGVYPTNSVNKGYVLNLESNVTYTISIKTLGEDETRIPPYLYLCRFKDNIGELVSYLTTLDLVNESFSFTPEDGYTYFLRIGRSSTETNFNNGIKNLISIQLELGSVATEYEPYYVKSNTMVVQDKNHTLNAIWEKNN